jgi:lipoic acid synthetase
MAGLGEDFAALCAAIRDLAAAGCDIVTVGQYLRPSRRHPEPARYLYPAEFERLAEHGRSLGIPHMYCGPLVRSSLHAEQFLADRTARGE